jgi:hypothetical protein
MSTNRILLFASSRIKCRQSKASSKRTGLQFKAPALKGKLCAEAAGMPTGPKTEQGRKRYAEATIIHGNET